MSRELMNPGGVFAHDDTPLAARRPLGSGTVVGLFSNQKANADLFLENMQALLAAKYDGISFIWFRKISSVPADFSDEFLNQCHVAVAAFGD